MADKAKTEKVERKPKRSQEEIQEEKLAKAQRAWERAMKAKADAEAAATQVVAREVKQITRRLQSIFADTAIKTVRRDKLTAQIEELEQERIDLEARLAELVGAEQMTFTSTEVEEV